MEPPTFAQLKPTEQINEIAAYVKEDHVRRARLEGNHLLCAGAVVAILAISVACWYGATTLGVLTPPVAALYANTPFVITDSGTKVSEIRVEELLQEWQKRQGQVGLTATLKYYFLNGTWVFSDIVHFDGSVEVVDNLRVRGNLEVDGTSLLKGVVTTDTDLDIGGDLTVDGTSTFVGAVEMDSSLIVAANITTLTSVQAAGTVVATGIIQSATDVRAGNISLVTTGLQVQIMCNNCPLCLCCVTPPC